jgi:hypothetical protein
MTLPRGLALVLATALAPSVARWARGQERRILREGVGLTPDLLRFAETLGISTAGGIRVAIVRPVPLPVPRRWLKLAASVGFPVFQPSGMALGNGIYLESPDPATLRHELVHVAQYERLGGIEPFMRRYLLECLTAGYAAAPLELEARQRCQGPQERGASS